MIEVSGTEHIDRHANAVPSPPPTESCALAVIAVVFSAGGLKPLRALVRSIPSDIQAAIVIAQHMGDFSILPDILRRDTSLAVVFARHGMAIRPGVIHVCPPGHHIVVNPDATLTLSPRDRLKLFRPNGDWFLDSASASFRHRAAAVVLSGLQDDAAAGVRCVSARGGYVIAQDPSTCEHADMPNAAIATGLVSQIALPNAIGALLKQWVVGLDLTSCQETWVDPFAATQATALS